MLPLEHSAILSTFIKLPVVIKTFVLSIFELPFYTGLLYSLAELCTSVHLCVNFRLDLTVLYHKNIQFCCGYLLEASNGDTSNKYLQHMAS